MRATDGHGANWLKSFAIADDYEESNGNSVLTFWEAQDKARSIARACEGTGDRPITVAEAIDAYAADLAARGARRQRHPRPFQPRDTLAAQAGRASHVKRIAGWA